MADMREENKKRLKAFAQDADRKFDESKITRADNGQFGSGSGGSKTPQKGLHAQIKSKEAAEKPMTRKEAVAKMNASAGKPKAEKSKPAKTAEKPAKLTYQEPSQADLERFKAEYEANKSGSGGSGNSTRFSAIEGGQMTLNVAAELLASAMGLDFDYDSIPETKEEALAAVEELAEASGLSDEELDAIAKEAVEAAAFNYHATKYDD